MAEGLKGRGEFSGFFVEVDLGSLVPVVAAGSVGKNGTGKDDYLTNPAAFFDNGVDTVAVLIRPLEECPLICAGDGAEAFFRSCVDGVEIFRQRILGGGVESLAFLKIMLGPPNLVSAFLPKAFGLLVNT